MKLKCDCQKVYLDKHSFYGDEDESQGVIICCNRPRIKKDIGSHYPALITNFHKYCNKESCRFYVERNIEENKIMKVNLSYEYSGQSHYEITKEYVNKYNIQKQDDFKKDLIIIKKYPEPYIAEQTIKRIINKIENSLNKKIKLSWAKYYECKLNFKVNNKIRHFRVVICDEEITLIYDNDAVHVFDIENRIKLLKVRLYNVDKHTDDKKYSKYMLTTLGKIIPSITRAVITMINLLQEYENPYKDWDYQRKHPIRDMRYDKYKLLCHEPSLSVYHDSEIRMGDFEWKFPKPKYLRVDKNNPSIVDVNSKLKFTKNNYPELRRSWIVSCYYGFENIENLKEGKTFTHKSKVHSYTYKVLENTKIDNCNVISFCDVNTKLQNDGGIPESSIKKGIDKKYIDQAWDCLYPENRIGIRRKYLKNIEEVK